MNNKLDVAVIWTKGRLEGHSNTVWFFLGIVVTVAMQQLGYFLASVFRVPFGDTAAIWIGALIAAAVTVTVFVEGYKFLLRRYGWKCSLGSGDRHSAGVGE